MSNKAPFIDDDKIESILNIAMVIFVLCASFFSIVFSILVIVQLIRGC